MADKILVVEDEFLSRNNMCSYLKSEGYGIQEAANGAEALEILAADTFELVITDFVMPHVDGLRLLELISDKWPELPAILITGYLSERAGRIIVEGKAAQVITKPIKLDELLEAVKRVLQSKSE